MTLEHMEERVESEEREAGAAQQALSYKEMHFADAFLSEEEELLYRALVQHGVDIAGGSHVDYDESKVVSYGTALALATDLAEAYGVHPHAD